jgi:hypothetical protein
MRKKNVVKRRAGCFRAIQTMGAKIPYKTLVPSASPKRRDTPGVAGGNESD